MPDASLVQRTHTTGHTRLEATAILLLVLASLVNLPAVYLLLKADGPIWLVLFTGLMSMGLGWAAGLHLERKRKLEAFAFAALGALQAFAVPAISAWDPFASVFILVAAACSLAALACSWRAR